MKNPIQMAVVREVNGGGIMLSGCGLLATVVYRRGFTRIYLNKLDIFVHRARFATAAALCWHR
jgi:hypothetical protein